MKTNLKRTLAALATVCLVGLAPSSQAALISSLFVPGANSIQDQDHERVLDASGNLKTGGSFAVGDRIQAILRWDTVNATTIADPLPLPYQFTAYSELLVGAIVDLAPFGQPGFSRLIFAPTGALGAGVLVELYERSAPVAGNSFSATVAPAAGIARILAQTLVSELGFLEGDDFWGATVPTVNAITIIAAATAGSAQASNGEFGLSVLSDPGNLGIVKNGVVSGANPLLGGGNLHDVVGNSSIYKRDIGVNSGWLVSSNTSAEFNVVPEPTSLALLGLGLLALGASRRRKA